MRTAMNPLYVASVYVPGPSTYNLFGNAPVGSSSITNAGTFLAGVMFEATAGSFWLSGYRYFIADGAQPTSAQPFALWQIIGTAATTSNDILVPGSTVTSGTLTTGWNFVPLTTPIALGATVEYNAATGFTGNFTFLPNQFGSGNPYAAGVTSGPLFAWSDAGGSAHEPFNNPQGLFDTSTANPAVRPPYQGSNSANFGMDVQVTNAPPPGASYRLWPSQPYPVNWVADTADNFTLAVEFVLSKPCAVKKIWFYSPVGTAQLPTETGIWDVSGEALVTNSHNVSPSWSGVAGSGFVSVDYTSANCNLAANTPLKVSVFNGAAVPDVWSTTTNNYWASPGFGQNGVSNGPISAPNLATASSPGQSSYHLGTSFHYPDTFAAGANGANYWVDIEVTPL